MKEVIIVDLDGTLADCNHRVHHVQKDPKDWKSFNSLIHEDDLNIWCKKIIDSMGSHGVSTILLTGRNEATRTVTEKWLKDHKIDYLELFMRGVDDDRSDSDIKKEIYLKQIAPLYDTLFVVEDRLSVVKMWRDINVTCLQCDWGDF
jgi:3-deoxy-D-manno-octulosonate 8-phosphate phosphatase KdsC-like HAD superfamily phosphatase